MQINKGCVLLRLELHFSLFEKSATEPKPKPKLLECKTSLNIVTFNMKTLNTLNLLPELTTDSKLEIKYHNTGNRWTFVMASAWKNSVNAIIGSVGMLLSLCALKSLNSIERN